MISLRSKFFVFIIIISTGIICGCNYTQTYTPDLNEQQQSIADSINSKYHFDAINISVKKTWGPDGNHSVLTIQFVNGVNIPSDDDTLKKLMLAWHLGKQAIKALKYPKQFDNYSIDFDTRKVHGDTTNDADYSYGFTKAQWIKNN